MKVVLDLKVVMDTNVREYFTDSESVNDALRSIIQLMEKVPARKYAARRTSSHQVAEKKK